MQSNKPPNSGTPIPDDDSQGGQSEPADQSNPAAEPESESCSPAIGPEPTPDPDPGEWLPALLAGASWVLAQFTSCGWRVFKATAARECVYAFLNQPSAVVALFPAGPATLPCSGKGKVAIAAVKGGPPWVRVFAAGGQVLYNQQLPDSPEARSIAKHLESSWRRKHLRKREKPGVLQPLTTLTGTGFRGEFYKVAARLDPSFNPAQTRRYMHFALRRFAVKWALEILAELHIPLDAPVPGAGNDRRSLHEIVADRRNLAGDRVLTSLEFRQGVGRALADLPARERKALLRWLEQLQQEIPEDAPDNAELRRRHDARTDFAPLYALHNLAESASGRRLIAFLADCLLDEPGREAILARFCRGAPLPNPGIDPEAADSARRRLLRAAHVLNPFFDRRRVEVLQLLPAELCRRLEWVLKADSTTTLARCFGCETAKLSEQIRLLQAKITLVLDAVIKRSSPTGRASLRRRFETLSDAGEKAIAMAVCLDRQSIEDAAAAQEVGVEQAKELLLAALSRMNA